VPSQSPHLDTTLVVGNVPRLAHRQNQQKRGPSENSQLPPAKRHVSVLAGERDVRGSPLTVIKIHDRSKKVHVLG